MSDADLDPTVPVFTEIPQAERIEYLRTLPIASLILRQGGVQIRRTAGSIGLPSILINMEDLFERFLRISLEEGMGVIDPTLTVGDGNKLAPHGSGVLFYEPFVGAGNSPPAKPDIVISGQDGSAVLLMDAKYKPSSALPERHEANQVVAYAVRYGCDKAMLVFPDREPEAPYVREIGRVGNVTVFMGNVSLGASDLQGEITAFAQAATQVL